MTAFLIITAGAVSIELEIDAESAHQRESETVGELTRSFAGTFLSDVEEFRVWDATAVNMTMTQFAALRAMVKEGAAVTIGGVAMGGELVTGIVEIKDAPFIDDARQDDGLSRTAALTIREG